MSKPSPQKSARRKARADKAERHFANRHERWERQEARRKVRKAEAKEAERVAAEARRIAWEADAPKREAEAKARAAEREAERARRALEPVQPEPVRKQRQAGGPLAAMMMLVALGGLGEER